MEKKYYEILGVDENASEETIKSVYEKILIRARHDDSIDIKAINDAYDHLTGNVKEEMSKTEKDKREKIAKRSNLMPFYIIGGIILIGLVALFLPSLFNKSPDLAVTFVGGYSINEQATELEDTIEDSGIGDVEITRIFVDASSGSAEADYSGRLALAGLLQGGDGDIFITTKQAFDYLLIDEGALLAFSKDMLDDLEIMLNDERLVYKDGTIYGIDVSDFELITNSVSGSDEAILCIANTSSNVDDSLEVIRLILQLQ